MENQGKQSVITTELIPNDPNKGNYSLLVAGIKMGDLVRITRADGKVQNIAFIKIPVSELECFNAIGSSTESAEIAVEKAVKKGLMHINTISMQLKWIASEIGVSN